MKSGVFLFMKISKTIIIEKEEKKLIEGGLPACPHRARGKTETWSSQKVKCAHFQFS